MKRCKMFKKLKTKDYKKINKIKIFLCSKNCEINYVLKGFYKKIMNTIMFKAM